VADIAVPFAVVTVTLTGATTFGGAVRVIVVSVTVVGAASTAPNFTARPAAEKPVPLIVTVLPSTHIVAGATDVIVGVDLSLPPQPPNAAKMIAHPTNPQFNLVNPHLQMITVTGRVMSTKS